MRLLSSLLILAVAPELAGKKLAGTMERSLPLFFIPNAGHLDPSIRYSVETSDLHAGFSRTDAIFQVQGTNICITFPGANANAVLEAAEPLAARVNLFYGDDPREWRTDVPTFHKIRYRQLYPGIDMTYAGDAHRIKSEFTVAPGADPSFIRVAYSAIDSLTIDSNGDLVVRAGQAELREEAPEIYQEIGGRRVRVSGRYVLLDSRTVGFELGYYNRSHALVIDPLVSYCTFIGGSGMSSVTGVAVDSSDNLYVTGWTESLDFPIAGAVQASNQGGVDVFIAKLNAAGTAIVYATYIGGRGDDRSAGIAVDSSGQAYVTGATASTNFPLAAAVRSVNVGGKEAFALKLNATGNTLLYSTFLGGSNYDAGTAIAIDGSGNAFIAGDTQSADFPHVNAAQAVLGGGMDAFVTKLSPTGAILYSTFLGGAANEHAGGIAVDASGNAYVAGGTFSTNFPMLFPIQAANGGSQDAFVTKLNATGGMVYSTYLGGNGGSSSSPEQANAVAVDSAGNAYVTGVTNSTNFPAVGAFQPNFAGVQDAFVTKINAAGTAFAYSTYLGGSSFDWAGGIRVDASGNAYVAGYTSSANFPTVSPVQNSFAGSYDAFITTITPTGNALSFSTLYGGTGSDSANAIALDASGNIFIGGQTGSIDLPLKTPIQANNTSGVSGWVLRLGVTAPPAQVPSANSVSPTSGSANSATFTAQFSHPAGASAIVSASLLVNNSAAPDYGCYITYTIANNRFSLANDVSSSGGVTVIPGGGSAQNDQCTLVGANSSATLSGTNLTLTIALIFQPGFAGSKTVFIAAADSVVNTGWTSKGTFTVTVPPPQPSVDSVAPNSGMGSSQAFTFAFSDTQSPYNLTGFAMLFATTVTQQNACYIVYDRNQGTVALLWDSGNGSDSKPIASTTTLQNSQCAIGAASATISGLSQLVTVNVTFKAAFSGLKNIYMSASEVGKTTGFVVKGTFSAASGGIPTADSVVPASGSGPAQRFSFQISDQGGSGYLTGMAVLFSTSLSTTNACYIVYDRGPNTLALSYDNPANGSTPIVLGSTSTVSNSQCSLRGINSTVVVGTTSIVVTLDLTFSANFFGAKNVYVYAAETAGVNSGYVLRGTWTVTGGAPTADSVTPSSGTGGTQSFTFQGSDSVQASNISGLSMLFTTGSPVNVTSACYLIYDRVGGTIGLYSDNGLSLATKPIGSSATLGNSQCAVGFTVANFTATSVQFTITVVFNSPAFSGLHNVYLQTNEAATNTGWVSRGAWTVP
jgi:hypothetical protein